MTTHIGELALTPGEQAHQRELDRKVAAHMRRYLGDEGSFCPRTANAKNLAAGYSGIFFDAEYIAAWDRLCVLRRRYIFVVKGVAK